MGTQAETPVALSAKDAKMEEQNAKDAKDAEKNSNLKGKTNLLDDKYTKVSESTQAEAPVALSAKDAKMDEQSAKDAKAARKAAMKAAKERQIAEAEAALK